MYPSVYPFTLQGESKLVPAFTLKAVWELRCVLESVNVGMFVAKLPSVGGFTVATHRARGRW